MTASLLIRVDCLIMQSFHFGKFRMYSNDDNDDDVLCVEIGKLEEINSYYIRGEQCIIINTK